mmetsp:Transcript_27579/g.35729  ORF Transcript_27579/g.35729 Transcript_27579/m.35729 type:complete len:659 (+) Transcript_27579:102-2078(+)
MISSEVSSKPKPTDEEAIPEVHSKKRTDALDAARCSALKLACSILNIVGATAQFYYDEGSPNPTLDPAPILYRTPQEEKLHNEKVQLETLQKTVAAKKCWVKVSELKREKVELERVLSGLQGNPSIIVGTQFENRVKSMIRLKESAIDVAIHVAQLAETELQAIKMIEHEERVVILHAKIASVERLKKEQNKRLKDSSKLLINKDNKDDNQIITSTNNSKKREYQYFFCDCYQGLSTWYSKCFIKRGWYPYPSEEWFITESTKLQIWSPLAKSSVDYCDTTSFSKNHSLLWEGGEWLEDKIKLSQLMKDTQLMPQTLVIPSGGWDGKINKDMLCSVSSSKDIEKWCQLTEQEDNNHAIKKFFVKDASRNYGTGVHVCRNFAEVKKVISDNPKDMFVVQEAIEPQLLIDGHRFGIRLYLAAVSINNESDDETKSDDETESDESKSKSNDPSIKFYTYSDGWITRPPKPCYQEDDVKEEDVKEEENKKDENNKNNNEHKEEGKTLPNIDSSKVLNLEENYDPKRNISRDRFYKLSSWNLYQKYFIKFHNILNKVLIQLYHKLSVKKDALRTFELFGVDFIIDHLGKVWLCEVNRSPRQMDSDLPMLHSLLDLIFNEKKTPNEFSDPNHSWTLLPLTENIPSSSSSTTSPPPSSSSSPTPT